MISVDEFRLVWVLDGVINCSLCFLWIVFVVVVFVILGVMCFFCDFFIDIDLIWVIVFGDLLLCFFLCIMDGLFFGNFNM